MYHEKKGTVNLGQETSQDDIWNLFETFEQTTNCALDTDKDSCCIYCNKMGLLLEEGNYTCQCCGSLNSRYIDMHAEWRYYGADDSKMIDPTRCGMPCNDLLPDSSLGSIISTKSGENHDMKMIRKYHMWNSMPYRERSLYNIFDNITVNAINSGISPVIIEEAKAYYKKASESKISRGNNRNGLIASSIYMSCKTNKVPRSSKEIAKIFNINSSVMNKGCKRFQDIVKVEINSTKSSDFIERFCSKLKLSMEIRDLCRHIVAKADELNIVTQNTPMSVIAGTIYLCNIVCSLGLSKKDVSCQTDTSAVTLSKCYKKLNEYRSELFTPEAIYKYSII